MKRCRKIVLGFVSLALIAAAVLAVAAYRELFGGDTGVDWAFYNAVEAGPLTEADYAEVLGKYVDDSGRAHYAGLKGDHSRLDAYVRAMAAVSPETLAAWDENAQIAFWLNAYNALTLKAILDHYPIRKRLLRSGVFPANSIRQIRKVWDRRYLVAGQEVSLSHIEHEVLRRQFDEPRIHVALVCAAMSCPRLRREPYVGARLDEQLADQSRGFVSDPSKLRIDRAGGTVRLSSILQWFGGDFVKTYGPAEGFGQRADSVRAALNFASRYLPAEDAEYLRTGSYAVEYLEYDWALNERTEPPGPAD